MIDLYHRTSPEAAAAILAGLPWLSRENTGEVYFSNRIDGQAVGYGDAIVHVRVEAFLADLDDEFPDGEEHYRIRVDRIRPDHVVGLAAPDNGPPCYVVTVDDQTFGPFDEQEDAMEFWLPYFFDGREGGPVEVRRP